MVKPIHPLDIIDSLRNQLGGLQATNLPFSKKAYNQFFDDMAARVILRDPPNKPDFVFTVTVTFEGKTSSQEESVYGMSHTLRKFINSRGQEVLLNSGLEFNMDTASVTWYDSKGRPVDEILKQNEVNKVVWSLR